MLKYSMKKYFIRDMDIPEHNKVAYIFNTGLTYIYLDGYNGQGEIHPEATIMFIEILLNYNYAHGFIYSLTGVVTFKKEIFGAYESYPDFKEELYNLIEKFGEKAKIVKENMAVSTSFNIKVKLIK